MTYSKRVSKLSEEEQEERAEQKREGKHKHSMIKKRKLKDLKLLERADIVNQSVVNHYSMEDIAVLHQVSVYLV